MPLSLYGQEGLRVKMGIEVLAVSITIVINMRRLTSKFQLHEIAAISTAFYIRIQDPHTIVQVHLFDRQAFEKPTTHLKSRRSSCQLHACR